MEKNGNYFFVERILDGGDFAIIEYGKFLAELPRYDASLGMSNRLLDLVDTRIIFEVTNRKGSHKTEASGKHCFATLADVWEWYDKEVAKIPNGLTPPRLAFGDSCFGHEN